MKNFPNRKIGTKYRWLCVLAVLPVLGGGACGPRVEPPPYKARITIWWDSPADLDLHMWAQLNDHCWVDACTTPHASKPIDDEVGTTGETITLDSGADVGYYRFGVNLHSFPAGSTPGDRTVSISISYFDSDQLKQQSYGPYILNVPIGHGGYPVTGNSASWWRPIDFRLLDDGSIQFEPADSAPCEGP